MIIPAGYRELKVGERIQKGDLIFDQENSNLINWRPTVEAGRLHRGGYIIRIRKEEEPSIIL